MYKFLNIWKNLIKSEIGNVQNFKYMKNLIKSEIENLKI